MDRPPGSRVDHYELLEHIADGAQVEVHRAKDVLSGEEVVVRFPHAQTLDNPILARRWRREAQLTEGLDHPHLQCRRDAGERHREPYMVVEYANGGGLDGWVSPTAPPLPIGQVISWGRQLAEALAYLHQRGVIHRDLKPANILVTDDLTLKLGDFGAATVTSKRRPLWYLPVPPEGTPEYLSPEQITGHSGDERSDVYGWGVVMYELLTGRVPITGPDPMAAMAAHLTASPVAIHELRPDVPPALEVVVLTALRRRPENRYHDAAALVAQLDRLDEVDATTFDFSPEPPLAGEIGGSEASAVLRFSAVIALSFVGLTTLIILLNIALR